MPRRTSRRRTSRNPKRQIAVKRVTIRRGSISGPGFKATTAKGGAFRGRIAVERGSGMVEFPSVAQLPRILREEGIPVSAAEKAFGRGRMTANGEEHAYVKTVGRERTRLGRRRTRRMKLGHISSTGSFVAGTRKGSLVLLDAKTGAIIWGAIEERPGSITNYATNRSMTIESVLNKAKSLRIPPQAVYDAFRHLMDAGQRKTLVATFHGMSMAR